MTERTWNIALWVGLAGSLLGIIAIFASYYMLHDSGIAIACFIAAIFFALVAAIANIGSSQARQARWHSEMSAAQRRVDDAISFAAANPEDEANPANATPATPHSLPIQRHLSPQGRALAEELEPEEAGEDEAHERAEHGNWE